MKENRIFHARECFNCDGVIITNSDKTLCSKCELELLYQKIREKIEDEDRDKMTARKCLKCGVMIITKRTHKVCRKCAMKLLSKLTNEAVL